MSERKYNFFGWETANVKAINPEYPDIHDPRELYDVLTEIWSVETCAPRLRDGWNTADKTRGQCSITAFLAQDIFGGEVYGILRKDGNYHCYNVVGECVFDLTSEQFGNEVLDYRDNPLQSRAEHFVKEEKRQRYEILRDKLKSKQTHFAG